MKVQLNVIRLNINTPLHISNIRGDYNTTEHILHSDTLHAAIMQTWAVLGKSEWILAEPEYCFSSLFPFSTVNGKMVYFFKKPYQYCMGANENMLEGEPGVAKKFKKVQYFDKEHFELAINAKYNATPECVKGVYLTKQNIDPDFISPYVTPRIRWHRNEEEDTEIFYMERLYFREGSGLYFIVQADDLWKGRILTALNLLSENGLGTDRAIGNGRFTFQEDVIELEIPKDASHCLNLSLFCPQDANQVEGMLGDSCGYDFFQRGGWIGEPHNTYRKKSIYMFTEGSVFTKPVEGVKSMGKSVDLRPDATPVNVEHPVYRVGKSLFIPIKV
jgi:CRISPR type III-A-associated RAMP protein Csm4